MSDRVAPLHQIMLQHSGEADSGEPKRRRIFKGPCISGARVHGWMEEPQRSCCKSPHSHFHHAPLKTLTCAQNKTGGEIMSREGASPTGLMWVHVVQVGLPYMHANNIIAYLSNARDVYHFNNLTSLLPASAHNFSQSFRPHYTTHPSHSFPLFLCRPRSALRTTALVSPSATLSASRLLKPADFHTTAPSTLVRSPPQVSHKASHRDNLCSNCPLSGSTAAAVHQLYRTLQQLQPFLCAARRGWVHCVGSGADESTIVVP